jgi:TonB-dependent receptor
LINYIDQSAHAFNPEMQTSTRTAPLNQGYSLSFGDRWNLFDSPLGVIASLTYSRKVTSHEGVQGRYDRGSVNSDQLTPDYIFQDQQGKDEVLAGGLLTLKYGFHPNHSIGWTLMHNRNGESVSRYLEGPWFYYTNDPNAKVRNFVLSYTERALTSNQLNGSHKLFGGKIQADWQYSYSTTHQDDPDLRFFVDEVEQRQIEDNEGNLIDTTIYLIRLDRYMAPQRLYRELDETGRDYRLNFMVPITERTKFRTGYAHNVTQRTHKERRFEYQNTSAYARYNGDIDGFISDVGIDTVRTRVVQGDTVYQYIFTNFLKETTELRNQYTGDKRITAAYGMIESPILGPFSFIGGVRYEHTHMFSLTESTSPTNHLGEINEKDWLPSLNLIYSVTPDMKVRASYGRTLARPTLREMTPAASVDWGTGDFFNGNADLKMTKIDNYDLRWEWFVRPGEVLSVSGFHKDIKNPIELSIVGDNNDIVVINSDKATVYGLELEARRRLDWVHSSLRNFSIGGNLTLAHSKVRIGDAELAELQGEYPDASEYREMSGQSPYLLNLDVGYNNYNSGTRVSVFFNVFGERFAYNSDHITPDVYEQARQQLDVMVAQRFFGNATLKLGVKNLLDADHEFVYEDRVANAATEVYERISPGRDFSLGLSYEVW